MANWRDKSGLRAGLVARLLRATLLSAVTAATMATTTTAVTAITATTPARAAPALPQGQKTITLISAAGERHVIGHATFTAQPDHNDTTTFDIKLDAPEFSEEFLSMRPFSCLAGEKEMWCHLGYPYDLKKQISAADLTDLEYALLFLHKPQTGYGIDPWNGLYFKMSLGEDGAITGTLHDVNLDPLGVPPADKSARLIGPENLTVSDPATHRFAKIEIK